MNRITICKKIIQSIQKYITDSTILEAHRAKGHFVRKRKLSMFQIILYLLYTSKASMFQNLSRIREDLAPIDFPNISKQAVSKARQFISPDLFKDLFDPSITKKMFQELYFYRWPVETKYKELKDRLAIEEFSGASTVSVFQEFYINLLFLISLH